MTMTDPTTNDRDAGAPPPWPDGCPVARALAMVGDRWSLLIIRDLLHRRRATFKDLSLSPERIPTNTLTDRLRKLEAAGVLARTLYQERPARYEYSLTERGRGLAPVLRQLALFGLGGDEEALKGWLAAMRARATQAAGDEERDSKPR